jgi:osmoprotectant transport system ATP-binding protein
MEAIVFDHVSKVYSGAAVPAVNDVSLDIPSGKTVVILGTSGSGKTTLMKMVNRLYEPTSGQIFVEGTEICDLPANELRRRIGYVIQQIGLFPHWTVAQNVATVPGILGWPKARREARVDELLLLMGLPPDEFRTRYPSQLSGGQQQRVGIARALAADPGIMLMDEPFGAVDAITRGHLQEEFLALQSRTHKTVLFVTHDVEEALHLADKLIVMDGGRVLQYDTSFNVIAHPANDFVAQLIGADDMMRLLRLVTVRNVVDPLEPETAAYRGEPMSLDDSMRDALSKLMRADTDVLPVADATGRLVGQVAFQTVREQLRRSPVPAHGLPAQ